MKLVCKLLAALLLWLFIACNNRTGQTSDKTTDGGAAAERKGVQPPSELHGIVSIPDNIGPMPAPPAVGDSKFTQPKIVKDGVSDDGVVAVPNKEEEDKSFNTEDYDNIVENRFLEATQNPLSTFSIDVDEAAYSNVRRFLKMQTTVPPDAVRIEEMLNYFNFGYEPPPKDSVFQLRSMVSDCPWNAEHQLLYLHLLKRR